MNTYGRITETQGHIYYDLTTTNLDPTGGNDIDLTFSEARSIPFIRTPGDYFLSIVRFSVDSGKYFPVFIPQIQTGQTDINLTIYKFAILNNTTNQLYTFNINYVPQDLTINSALVEAPLQKQDMTTSYYYLYSYQWWLQIVNQQIFVAMTSTGVGPSNTDAISFSLDPSTLNVIMTIPSSCMAEMASSFNPPSTPNYQLFFNPALANLFSTLSMQKYSNNTYPSLQNWSLINFNQSTCVLQGSNYLFYTENSPLALWNPVASVVFSMEMLPIAISNVGTPKIFNQPVNSVAQNSANISNTVSDIVVDFGGANSTYKPFFIYIPQGEYRLTDMYSNNPISSINVNVYWKDRFDNTYPIKLSSGCSSSIKILFRAKQFNNM